MRVSTRQRATATAFAITAHLVVILLLLMRSPEPPMAPDIPITVSLVPDFTRPRPAPVRAPRDTAPTKPISRPLHPPPAPQVDVPPVTLPPGGITGPATAAPGPARAPEDAGAAALSRVLRSHLGCANPAVTLTDVERDRCNERLGHDVANARPYPVLSPKLKKIFDGTVECKPDDEWCLYRMGKGPYPGLIGMVRKKKKTDWD